MSELPESPEEKEKWRDQRWRVQRLFLEEWDPIGVDDDDLEDEYAAYANAVVAKIRAGEDNEEIVEYLKWVVVNHMGMPEAFNRRLTLEIIEKTRLYLA